MIGTLSFFRLLWLTVTLVSGTSMFLFFLFWSFINMPRLDKTPAKLALNSMNDVNVKIRQQPLFLIPFLLTPLFYLTSAWLIPARALLFYLATIVYILGVIVITVQISEPLNLQLERDTFLLSDGNEEKIWQSFSKRWQLWNFVRTLSSGGSLLLYCLGIYM